MIEFEQGGGIEFWALGAQIHTITQGHDVHMIGALGAGVEDYPGTLQTHSRYN